MTRAEAIRALADKVREGEINADAFDRAFPDGADGTHQMAKAIEAFHGSLDAAKALHEAVLPGWRAEIWQAEEGDYGCNLQSEDEQLYTEFSDMMARSWLRAILAALEAMETTPETQNPARGGAKPGNRQRGEAG